MSNKFRHCSDITFFISKGPSLFPEANDDARTMKNTPILEDSDWAWHTYKDTAILEDSDWAWHTGEYTAMPEDGQ